MKDFDKRLAELGKWIIPMGPKSADKPPKYLLNKSLERDKPRCPGDYPFCTRSMLITFHTQTNSRAEANTAKLMCKICHRGGIFNWDQWSDDLHKSKKSE
jgi:hypothetical protein